MENKAVQKTYKQVGQMSFDARTPLGVCQVLSSLNQSNRSSRVRIFLGDAKTGLSWLDENDVLGYIGRSSGTYKVPLLIPKRNSSGGGAILDHCIIRIVDVESRRVLYTHPKFHLPQMVVRGNQLYVNGKLHANCETPDRANKLMEFLQGKRFAK